jgi:hypothetical protein
VANFRTEFAGDANMRPKTQMDEYRPTIAPIEDSLYEQNGRQPGDPGTPSRAELFCDVLGAYGRKTSVLQERSLS